ncbi:MAG: phosphoribosylaminoimidazolesuccinocarboxamide synthase [Candidatus Ancillula sp.]|nr:phosphoribosylaminoimidazolesuccinocarboxamide synthase [Candidatus Ancillula sp.]
MKKIELSGFEHLSSGKVREIYAPKEPDELGSVVLIVATDRISAFDHILSPTIPDKGKILTDISRYWFSKLNVPNHFITTQGVPEQVVGRAMFCKRLEMIPVECVARGYLTGSAYQEYACTGKFQEFVLPKGLKDGDKLDEVLFTPAIKAQVGEHDENVPFDRISQLIGSELAERLKQLTLNIYETARQIAESVGITLVDTKFEFGIDPETEEVVLGDEVLTPDSSRYWDKNGSSYDKQFVRNYLLKDSGWNPKSNTPPPDIPPEVAQKTAKLYAKIRDLLLSNPTSNSGI